jgi:hypothetical protein
MPDQREAKETTMSISTHYHGGAKCGMMHDPSCKDLGPESSCTWDATRSQWKCDHSSGYDVGVEGEESEGTDQSPKSSPSAK